MVPQSIADSYAEQGPLAVLPCLIELKMEAFGSIIRSNRSLSEAAKFFLTALQARKSQLVKTYFAIFLIAR